MNGLRDAVAADVPAIVALVHSAYRGESSRAGWTTEADLLDGGRTDEPSVAATVGRPDDVILLAEDPDGGLRGCCHLQRRADGTAYFGMFAVDPTRQAAGLGSRLLAAAEQRARSWGAGRMEMTVIGQRTDLIAWYERRGYRPTGEREPWPYDSPTFGRPRRDDLYFCTLAKQL